MGRPRKPMTKEQERQIVTLRKRGYAWRAIAKIMGINHMRVARYGQQVLGLPVVGSGYAPLSAFRGKFNNSKM
ncbi:MAG: hypothetical protein ABF824_13160 [Acetobacter sp.]